MTEYNVKEVTLKALAVITRSMSGKTCKLKLDEIVAELSKQDWNVKKALKRLSELGVDVPKGATSADLVRLIDELVSNR